MAAKANCWEVKKCGRQPGGARTGELGTCPAATTPTNGANGGKNAGRICWAVAGTLCGGKVQGSFAQKLSGCASCEFYSTVKKDEAGQFKLTLIL